MEAYRVSEESWEANQGVLLLEQVPVALLEHLREFLRGVGSCFLGKERPDGDGRGPDGEAIGERDKREACLWIG